MEQEYDGRIDNIGLPDFILLEVRMSVLVESNFLDTHSEKVPYSSGSKGKLDTDLFESYLGDGLESDVPVIKYSSEKFAPALCGELRLKTPNYYRGLEAGVPGLYDQFEGCRFSHQWGPGSEMVVTPEDGSGRRLVFDASGATTIDLCSKTFMYCTSLDSESNLLSLEKAAALYEPDYTHGSAFRNSKELAQHILKSFAATISRSMIDVAEPSGEESFARTYAWIVHGPVRYLPDVDMGIRGIESYFTKPDVYRAQNEYRFWVGFNDTPVQSEKAEILLPLPKEIVAAVELE